MRHPIRTAARRQGNSCQGMRSIASSGLSSIGITPSGTGAFATLAGYVGVTVGWVEGLELNFFGAVLGLDVRRPALKLPGLGRFELGKRPTPE